MSEIVFREHAHASMGRRFTSLFPGLGYAAGYKVLQRTYKFGAQRFVKDYFSRNHKPAFTGLFGDQHGVNMMHACAGSLVGAGEVALLPLDVLKIKSQTNPEVLAGRGLVQLVSQERFALYRGWEWTIARNMPGSFSLFGDAALVKGSVFGLEDYSKATFFQNFVSSIGGAVASISVARISTSRTGARV